MSFTSNDDHYIDQCIPKSGQWYNYGYRDKKLFDTTIEEQLGPFLGYNVDYKSLLSLG